jgi:hypothetical protein
VEFDFRADGSERWDIRTESAAGALHLGAGGASLTVAGKPVRVGGAGEYEVLYRQFEGIVRERRRELDSTPLQLVADAFLIARRRTVEPFLV